MRPGTFPRNMRTQRTRTGSTLPAVSGFTLRIMSWQNASFSKEVCGENLMVGPEAGTGFGPSVSSGREEARFYGSSLRGANISSKALCVSRGRMR